MAQEAQALTLVIDPVHLVVPRSAWTLPGFRTWVTSDGFPPNVHATWVEGEVLVEMSPESIDTHNNVKTEITAVLRAIARDEELGELYGDRVLYTNEQAGISTEPDVLFASFDAIEQGRVTFTPKANRPDDRIEIQGTPDLVVEVLSDSSQRKDETLLRAAYARAGVPEYWIVDARGDALRFELLTLRADAYVASDRSIVLARSFRLERKRNRISRFSYRLSAAT